MSSPNGAVSNLIISGIPCAVGTNRQFTTAVYAVFSWADRGLQIPGGDTSRLLPSFCLQREHSKVISEID
jgi:hypothetical protein